MVFVRMILKDDNDGFCKDDSERDTTVFYTVPN